MAIHSIARPTLVALVSAALVSLPALAAAPQAVAPQSVVEGTWQTALKSEITIAPCSGSLCGYITKIVVPPEIAAANKDALAQIGDNFFDYNNKDPALRNRPIQGLMILTLHQGNSPAVYDGEIYNPQDGNTYSGYVQVLGPDKIRLNGCILYNVICKGEDWVRVPNPDPPPVLPDPMQQAAQPQ